MPRSKRWALLVAVAVCFAGLLLAIAGPAMVFAQVATTMNPRDLVERPTDMLQNIEQSGLSAPLLSATGLVVSLMGAAYALWVFVPWFTAESKQN